MMYKDKSTLRWQRKQLEKDDYSKSDRTLRREEKRNLEKFRVRVCRYVDSDWWDSFTTSEQMSIYRSWLNSGDEWVFWKSKFTSTKQPSDNDFDKWIKRKYDEVKPNMSVYRDKKLDRILNED